MRQKEIDCSEVFGHMLVCRHQRENEFHFDLRRFDLEKVKTVLEANGYAVEQHPADRSWILVSRKQELPGRGSQERQDSCYLSGSPRGALIL